MTEIALIGNPNSGKTSLFNLITGTNQRVGNWPGVTVERKSGFSKKDKSIQIQDLPGIYSMSPYSPEEKVARDYLLSQEADSILNVVDATNLERNLYLTTQLIETGIPVTVALNMSDVLEAQGRFIDTEKLSYQLGVPVIATSAIKQTGVEKAIKNKDYNEAYELLQAMCKQKGIKWNLYLRYYTYFGACKLFDDGNYKAAYENFDKIRGFRDVDSFYKKEEYEYLKLCGTWYMVDSQINADFILSISGKQMVVTTIEYGYYDSQTNEISFTLVKKDNKYIMQQSDGQCDYYLTFFDSKLELREYDTGSLIGTFVCEDAE